MTLTNPSVVLLCDVCHEHFAKLVLRNWVWIDGELVRVKYHACEPCKYTMPCGGCLALRKIAGNTIAYCEDHYKIVVHRCEECKEKKP